MTLARKVFASAVVYLAVFVIAQTLGGRSGLQNRGREPTPVTPENFVRAESDLYFGGVVQITEFKSGRIFSFSREREGNYLFLAKGDVRKDVVLISNLR